MRICVLGNSNIAAVKDAWDGTPKSDLAGVTADFFGARAPQWKYIQINDSKLWANSALVETQFSGEVGDGREYIDLASYDVLFIHGFLIPRPLYRINAEIALHAQNESVMPSSGLMEDTAIDMISHSLWARISQGAVERRTIPIVTSVRQFPSRSIVDDEADGARYAVCRNDSNEANTAFISTYMTMVSRQCEAAGHIVLSQPAETICDRFFTKPEYSVGSRRLSSSQKHRGNDYWHANTDYGSLVVGQYLRVLDGL